jgi:hypothetical protein
MAMAVSRDNALAMTVSADHLIGQYELNVNRTLSTSSLPLTLIRHASGFHSHRSHRSRTMPSCTKPSIQAARQSRSRMLRRFVLWQDGTESEWFAFQLSVDATDMRIAEFVCTQRGA